MSVTGPGCPACDYRGRIPFDGEHPFTERPCGACSPWTHRPDFPDEALRAKAAGILRHGSDDTRMIAWAVGLMEYAAEVDADRARLAATTCAPARGRCGR